MTKTLHNRFIKILFLAILSITLVATSVITDNSFSYAASVPNCSGYTDSSSGVILRKSASTSSSKLAVIKNNVKVTIKREVFTSKTSTSLTKRWYYVTVNGKTGYIRADLIDGIKYASATGKTTDALNYRVGPATTMKRKGTLKEGTKVTIKMVAKKSGVSQSWYRIKVGSKYYYVSGKYVKVTSSGTSAKSSTSTTTVPDNISAVAKALRAKTTNGGSCRIVYTFDSSNCSKKWKAGVTGYSTAKVPQGMAFNGKQYCILFAMDNTAQALVFYDTKGNKVKSVKFSKDRGHLNGMTWDPDTNKYYIFKGNQTTIYTYDPSSGSFGTAKTPYSSSGIGYDSAQSLLYATSLTGVREYTADGKFNHNKLFSRCTYSGTTYIQDCCAHDGFVFHCISGSDKASKNYIDVYRTEDGKYMGTIQTKMGEIESCTVNSNGYLEILCNTAGTPDYIWTTPLNVSELKQQ